MIASARRCRPTLSCQRTWKTTGRGDWPDGHATRAALSSVRRPDPTPTPPDTPDPPNEDGRREAREDREDRGILEGPETRARRRTCARSELDPAGEVKDAGSDGPDSGRGPPIRAPFRVDADREAA